MIVYIDGHPTPVCDRCNNRFRGSKAMVDEVDYSLQAQSAGWSEERVLIGSTPVLAHTCDECAARTAPPQPAGAFG